MLFPLLLFFCISICRITTETNAKGVEVQKPLVMHKYNKLMGGVDLADELKQEYEANIRTVKMYKKVIMSILWRVSGEYIMYILLF